MDVSPSLAKSLYRTMLLIRRFEETVRDKFAASEIPGFVHLYIGEEAIAAGVMAALRDDDYIMSTHRGHGHLIAKGADIRRLMAELYGKKTGLNKGYGGSMHAAQMSRGIIGANGIVGSGIGIATGAALALKYKKSNSIVASFFGDGATNIGAFHESLTMASIWNLPILYVCENNQYAATIRFNKTSPVKDAVERVKAYGMKGLKVDGTDPVVVYKAANSLVNEIRRGEGPRFLEAVAFRVRGHFEGDPQHYRKPGEVDEWLEKNDPVEKFRRRLLEEGVLTEEEDKALRKEIEDIIIDAVEYARSSPYPEGREALNNVYYEGRLVPFEDPVDPGPGEGRVITFVEAVREALDHEMGRDPNVIVLGEDVVSAGVWGVTRGLAEKYGADVRVIDTPIAEQGFTLVAIGAAIMGLRVVVEHRFSDFLYLPMDAILNHAAKLRYMTGGQIDAIPVVIRSAMGAGVSAAAQHSSTNASMFANHPGVKVVAPSTPYDAKGLFLSSLRDGNAVLFYEHKKLYRMRGPVPEHDYVIPLGKADVKRKGDDITIVSYSYMVHEALAAAKVLEDKHGVSAEVIDLRTLYPLDREAIRDSVSKTGRILVVDEGWAPASIASEVITTAMEEAIEYIDSVPARLNTLHAPIPFSPPMEQYVLPNRDKIVDMALQVVGKRPWG